MCNSNFVTALQQLSLQTLGCYYYFYYVISKFRTSTVQPYGLFSVMANSTEVTPKDYVMLLVHLIASPSSLEPDTSSRTPQLQTVRATDIFPWSRTGLSVNCSHVNRYCSRFLSQSLPPIFSFCLAHYACTCNTPLHLL